MRIAFRRRHAGSASRTPAPAAMCILAAVLLAPATPAAVRFVDDLNDGRRGTGTRDDPFRDLQTAIDNAADGDVLRIAPGVYSAEAESFVDSLCGNCEEHRTPVPATRGFAVIGKGIQLVGAGPSATTLKTNAGYGLYFKNSIGSLVTAVRITGGRRDTSEMATDAGVVARRSRVTISGVEITDNTDRPEGVVVGIAGVVGREGAELIVTGNEISNNGWDGIALYRGAVALVADNTISVGRGAGIGITWDAAATILRNDVSGYWKGIGTFGSSRAVVRNNAVHDNLGWGVIATGTSFLEASHNTIVRNGNCGFAVWSGSATGLATGNIIVANGWREEWVSPCVGVWVQEPGPGFALTHNDVWGNTAGDYEGIENLTGRDGNVSFDPLLADSLDFSLREDSPAFDAGNPLFTDPDGGPPDLGITGGPGAR